MKSSFSMFRRGIFAGFLWLCLAGALLAKDWRVGIVPAPDMPENPERMIVTLALLDGPVPTTTTPLPITSSVSSPASYELQIKKDGAWKPVNIVEARPNGHGQTNIVRLRHDPKVNLADQSEYRVRVKPGVWHLTGGDTFQYANNAEWISNNKEWGPIDKEYLTNRYAHENKLKLQTGTSGGAVSLQYSLITGGKTDDYRNDGFWRLQAKAKADFTIPSKDRRDFFNRVHAEVFGFYQAPYPEPDRTTGDAKLFRLYWDAGAHVSFDSDATFDTMDVSGGVKVQTVFGNPVTDFLGTAFIGKDVQAVLSPVISLAYDGVTHISEDAAAVDTGSQRAVWTLFWRWPLARNSDFVEKLTFIKALGLNNPGKLNVDLISELEGVYDVDTGRYSDNSEVALEITPSDGDSKKPSLTFTYARGKVKPTYKNFEAFLVGFKFPF